jgi:hypothetical protein
MSYGPNFGEVADRRLMGGFYTRAPMRVVGWLGAVLVIWANGWLVYTMILKLDGIALVVAVLCAALCILLLAYVAFVPLGRQSPRDQPLGAELPI